MTNKPSLSSFWRARSQRDLTEPDYKQMLEDTENVLDKTVYDLASANNHIAILKEQLAMANPGLDRNGNPVKAEPRFVSGKLDIPVDLGDGTIVIISGMPGRPTKAACERLCNIIMSFAFTPSTTTQPKAKLQDQTVPEISDDAIMEVLRPGSTPVTAKEHQLKHAPLGSKATQVAQVSSLTSPNPEV